MSAKVKYCRKCDSTLPLCSFNKDRSKKDGLNIYCSNCRKKMSKSWKKRSGYLALKKKWGPHFNMSDTPALRAQKKADLLKKKVARKRSQFLRRLGRSLRVLVSNIEERKKKAELAAWQSKNKVSLKIFFAALLLKARELQLESFKRYNQTKRVRKDPSYYAPMHAKRRAIKISALLPSTDHDLIKQFFLESKAKTESTGIPHHVDHIIPLSVGGSHHQDNLQVIPAAENLSKQAHFKKEDAKIVTRWALNKESILNKLSPHYGKKCNI